MRRPLVRLVFAFAAGAFAGAVLPVSPGRAALACAAVSVLSLALCMSYPSLAAILATLFAGVLTSSLFLRSFAPRDVAASAGEEKLMRLRARVVSSPLLDEGVLVLRARELDAGRGWRRTRGRVIARTLEPVPVGTDVEFLAIIEPSSDRDVLARAVFARAAGLPAFSPLGRSWGVKALFWELRRFFVGSLHRSLPPGRAALLSALLFGYRGGISRNEWRKYAESGTGHLLSVSGLHLGLVAGMGWLLVWRMGIRRKRAAWVVGGLAIFYTLLTGARVPTIRACVMVLCFVASEIIDRPRDALNVIAFAALAILCWRPTELLSAGFQLSFCSVAAIALLYPRFQEGWRSWRKFPEQLAEEPTFLDRAARLIRAALFVSLAAWLGVMPLVACHFGVVSLYAVPANALVVPVVGFVMGSGVLASIASLVLPAAAQLAALPALLLSGAVSAVAALPFSHVDVPAFSIIWAVAFYGLAALYVGRLINGAWTAGCLLLLVAAFVIVEGLPGGSECLKVGCTSRGCTKLVACPPREGILVNCEDSRAAAELLRTAGLTRPDVMIICADDERVAEAAEFVSRCPPSIVLLPSGARPSPELAVFERELRRLGTNYAYPERGDVLRAGEVSVRFVAPPRTGPWPQGARDLAFEAEWKGAKASFGQLGGKTAFIDCQWDERYERGDSGAVFYSAARAGAFSPAFSSLGNRARTLGAALLPCRQEEFIVFDSSGRILLRGVEAGLRIARITDLEEEGCH